MNAEYILYLFSFRLKIQPTVILIRLLGNVSLNRQKCTDLLESLTTAS